MRDIIIEMAEDFPMWGPLRVWEELRDRRADMADLTDANVHWVFREYGLAEYTERMSG